MNYDYFYGGQSESFSFYRIPRLLVTGAEFRHLSTDAKLLYGMMLDRMGLSARNGWYDELDRVYIYYTVDEIMEDLCCGHNKAVRLLAELDTVKGVGLIERKKQGQGKPTIIYVRQFVETARRGKSTPPRLPKTGSAKASKGEAKTARNDTSRLPESGSADCPKREANYTDISQNENSYTDPSIVRKPLNGSHCRERQCSEIQGLSSSQTRTQPQSALGFAFENENYEDCLEELKEQIDYPLLAENYPYDDPECILELICDVLCSMATGIKIGRETIPSTKVKARFRKLRFEHISYVLDSLNKTTSDIKNIRAYLLTALYNAPVTIDAYYSAAVRHDFAGNA